MTTVEEYNKDMDNLESKTSHSWNERACGQQKDTDDVQIDDYFVCTGNKPYTYKVYEENLQKCTYMDKFTEDVLSFYNKQNPHFLEKKIDEWVVKDGSLPCDYCNENDLCKDYKNGVE